MTEDGLRYDQMVEDALRSVVREALIYAVKNGLPGNHHFYITFRTDGQGVEMPDYLRERYPGEMTIVLQHQYWGLKVDDETFTVTLSFNDVPESLCIPLACVTSFADPSVRFGLQFDDDQGDDLEASEEQEPEIETESGEDEDDDGAPDEPGSDSEKVVTLDTFRNR